MTSFTVKKYIPFILIITVFGVYLSTISPVVYLGDSGELTAAAFSLGIPHGSGYPLYSLVGKLFCMIPLGNVGFRMNLMSTFFSVFTVWLVYSFILKITSSILPSLVAAFILAFTPIFWSQTISAEVYPLHTFFVALMVKLLWWWDEKKEFYRLALFAFVTGISFGNHLQTVMLAVPIFFIIFSSDKNVLLNVKPLIFLSVLFILALSLYLYLPIRTDAGAAIHWGDPNTLDRFLAHVTGKSHRTSYVFNKGLWEYIARTSEALRIVGKQFGVLLLLAFWGLAKLPLKRWKAFFAGIIIFDLMYTVFLNTISLKVTAFSLPTFIIIAILVGLGINALLEKCGSFSGLRANIYKTIKVACCIIPSIPFMLNFDICDQSKNYTAYEHALNIFRTTNNRDILFMHGDNYLFPVTYGRIVERMREDVTLHDRLNIIFKIPNLDDRTYPSNTSWEEHRNMSEGRIIEEKGNRNVFYAVFGPYSIKMPNQYGLAPCGILHRVVKKEAILGPYEVRDVWRYYSTDSFYENFVRDFMNREVCAYFFFNRGKYFFLLGQPSLGLENIKIASHIGHDDTLIHTDIAIFLTDRGFFKEARQELEKTLIYYEDLGGVHNNWGYYYHKVGDHNKAIDAFRKAIELSPEKFGYHNNLAFSLYEAGKRKEALLAFQKSLAINENQPGIHEFIQEHSLTKGKVE